MAEKVQKIIVWWHIPDPIMGPFFQALCKNPWVDIACIYEKSSLNWRQELGWQSQSAVASSITLEGDGWKKKVHQFVGNGAKHLFGGIAAYPKLRYALKTALQRGDSCFAATESFYRFPGIRSIPRNIRALASARIKWLGYGRRLSGLFAIGTMARTGLLSIGYKAGRVYDWMYFVKEPEKGTVTRKSMIAGARFAFVGQLIARKGVDILLAAWAKAGINGKLTVFGAGLAENRFKEITNALAISDKVEWAGVVPNTNVIAALSEQDVLVLPSRFDGWGAVINEAIEAGCAVICSDRCGAADLVRSGKIGYVFKCENSTELADCMSRIVQPELLLHFQSNALLYRERIRPQLAVEYFLDAINGKDGGKAPWLD